MVSESSKGELRWLAGLESEEPATVTITVDYGEMLVLDQPAGSGSFRALTPNQLLPIGRAAIDRWRTAGEPRA